MLPRYNREESRSRSLRVASKGPAFLLARVLALHTLRQRSSGHRLASVRAESPLVESWSCYLTDAGDGMISYKESGRFGRQEFVISYKTRFGTGLHYDSV